MCLTCPSGKYASSQNSSGCTAIGTCGVGTYIKTAGSSVANVVCGACKANCSAGAYLQGSCGGLDFSDVTSCVTCLSGCLAGQYLSFSCTGLERVAPTCRSCSETVCSTGTYYGACPTGVGQLCPACKACASGYYTSQCGGTFEGLCVPCTNCSKSGLSAVTNCSRLADTVCAGGACGVNVSCSSGMFCNQSTGNASGCAARWTFQSDSTYLCVNTSISGVCLPCPKGWTADGSFCLPCLDGKSCTEAGVPACEGACQAGYSPSCDQATGRVVCTRCEVNQAVQDASNRVVTRGGILDRPDLCDAYFQCKVGFVLTVTRQYAMVCVPCRITEPVPSMFVFYTHGLTTGDVYSCLYRRAVANVSGNALGTYGVYSVSCPLYTTAEAGAAANFSQCASCAAAPDYGALIGSSAHCRFTCNSGYTQVGFGCVSAVRFKCTVAGYFAGSDGRCWANPLPWNLPGNSDKGGLDLRLVRWAEDSGLWAWDGISLDADSMVYSTRIGVRAVSPPLGGNVLEAALCNRLVGSTFNWGVSDAARDFYVVDGLPCDGDSMLYYTVYMVAKGPTVYRSGLPWSTETVLLQRGFGVYNQWRMWLLLRSTYVLSSRRDGLNYDKGDVGGSWELPGKVCAVVLGRGTSDSPYWFLHFCGSFSISVATVVSPSQGLRTWVTDPLRFGLLAGGGEAGNSDGFRDEARFGTSLSMALAPGTGVLLVADRYNCRLAEVRFTVPGAFDTSVYTLYQGCYAPAAGFLYQTLAIPFPRLLTVVLGGSVFLFVTDDGLVQLDWGLRQLQLLAGAAYLPPNAIAVGMANWKDGVVMASSARAYDYSVNVYNGTHYVMLTATQLPCPAGSVSFAGGDCVPCPPRTFALGNACVVCGGVSSCAAGTVLVACNATADARCQPCPAQFSAGVAFRWIQGCVAQLAAPCPLGYYAVTGGLCSACPQWSNTSRANATSILNCTCANGGVLDAAGGACNVSSPWPTGVGVEAVPDWLGEVGCGVDECPLRGCYLAWVSPRICRDCPAGTVGGAGLWCSPCGVGRIPNPSLDLCVCAPPGLVGWDSVGCVCPAGHVGSTQGCVRCPENTVSPGGGAAVVDSGGSSLCVECPLGNYSVAGASSCVACAPGTYRQWGMALCSRCPDPRAYATDPTSVASCVPCVSRGGCGLGMREAGCPVDDSLATCVACGALLPGEHWVDAAYNTNCLVACDDGWWSGDGWCVPCTEGLQCKPGWGLSACAAFSDAACDVECFNATMPMDNSEWGQGCAWRCADGYSVAQKQLADWVEYACEPLLSVFSWEGWF